MSTACPVMSAGSSCGSIRAPQHTLVAPPSSSPAATATGAAAAGGGNGNAKSEQQPLVVVDTQQITTQVLADYESFVRTLTKFDLLARKSHLMDAALCNIAALCHNAHRNPLAYWVKVSGHDSPEEQELHSLCCSMLKLSASRMSWRDDTANQLRWAAAACSAVIATAAIPDDADLTDDLDAALGLAAVEGNLGLNTSSSHHDPKGQAAPSAGSDGPYSDAASKSAAAAAARLSTVSSMPSLAIFGRCCLQASQQLKEQIPVILQQRLGFLQGQPMLRGQPGCPFSPQNSTPLTDAAGACLEFMMERPLLSSIPLLSNIVMLLVIALKSDEVQVEGCEVLLQELQQLSAAAMDAITPQATAAPLLALVKQLQVTGLACCSHPVAPMCNNPSCSTTRGDTELGLVTGKSCMCGGCRVAHYCCRACQQEHWELHKPACKALVAAAAAAK